MKGDPWDEGPEQVTTVAGLPPRVMLGGRQQVPETPYLGGVTLRQRAERATARLGDLDGVLQLGWELLGERHDQVPA